MAHRGGGYGRGGGGFRQRGRASPYWKDKPRQQTPQHHGGQQTTKIEDSVSTTPSRDHDTRDGDHSHQAPEQSPADTVKGVKKFSNKARLFMANLPRDLTESELRALFEPHGEVHEIFLQKEKNFGFCRMVSLSYLITF